MMSRLALLLPLLLAGLLAGPRLSSAARPTGWLSAADSNVLQAASLRLRREHPGRVALWLRAHRPVRSAVLGRDGQTIDIRFLDGKRAAILPATMGTIGLQSAFVRPYSLPRRASHSPAGRALVLSPFATELQTGCSANDVVVGDLQAAGYTVDSLCDTSVTVGTMTTLSQYNVVYMHTHSGPGQGGEGIVATGELANGDPSVAQFLADGSVIISMVAGSTQQYYGITPRFILYHEGQFSPGSLLFVNGCSLLSAPGFWQALSSKGLGVLVSWDGESTVQDNYLSGAAFFAEMDQGQTVAGAISAEQAAGYGKSTVNGQVARLGYLGDGSIALASGGSTPTPSPTPPPPTATPTPPLPTATSTPPATSQPGASTPRPTATPSPPATARPTSPPPLSVRLKPRVRPGTRQVITARSGPGVTVQFRVTFPNGQGRSATTTTNAAGVARYTYVQAPSKILYKHLFATVLVRASNGAAGTAQTARYRIGWGRIDVAVVPARQIVGRVVTIWVHTRPDTGVGITLQTPNGARAIRLTARTGARGWVHIPYRLGQPFRAATKVLVRAQVQLGGSVYRTRTTLSLTP